MHIVLAEEVLPGYQYQPHVRVTGRVGRVPSLHFEAMKLGTLSKRKI